MSEITIRPATVGDSDVIKEMVNSENLNPFSLHWEHFLIAEIDGQMAGIGQIKPHGDCEELASIVTHIDYRGQGVARILITALEAQAGRPLYLKCAAKMEAYYEQFGYKSIPTSQAPRSFKFIGYVMQFIKIFGMEGRIMRKDSL